MYSRRRGPSHTARIARQNRPNRTQLFDEPQPECRSQTRQIKPERVCDKRFIFCAFEIYISPTNPPLPEKLRLTLFLAPSTPTDFTRSEYKQFFSKTYSLQVIGRRDVKRLFTCIHSCHQRFWIMYTFRTDISYLSAFLPVLKSFTMTARSYSSPNTVYATYVSVSPSILIT